MTTVGQPGVLKERGHEIFLFTYRGEESDAEDPNTTIFTPDSSGIADVCPSQLLLPDLPVIRAVRNWLKEIKPDILHMHTNYSFTSSVLLGCRGIVPAVQTVHDFRLVCLNQTGVTPSGRLCGGGVSLACVRDRCVSPKRYALEFFKRRIHHFLFRRTVYSVIAPSRSLCSAFDREGLPAVHIPHFSDIELFSYQPIERNNDLILFVGYLFPSKGVGLLLQAFREVLKAVPTARLVIAGDGPMMGELREYHRTLELGEAVTFLGAVHEKEMNRWYQKSTFVVLPSIIYENSPLIIYEAMASGRAVVGTRIGGIPELVEEGKTGLLFGRNNSSELAAKITTLLRDKDLADQMGKAGRKRAETEFTMERHLDGVLTTFEKARQSMP
jgi:glycosyltransferase involved in cell wall biosynthesis